jgi:hypothetical protein
MIKVGTIFILSTAVVLALAGVALAGLSGGPI